ncbi:hypothetical protein ACP8HZ_04570 [Francisella noatunensis]
MARNQILRNQLEKSYSWFYEINGFDKSSKHKENGFMFDAKSLDDACKFRRGTLAGCDTIT